MAHASNTSFEVRCDALPAGTELLGFVAQEAVSEPYSVALFFAFARSDAEALSELHGVAATLHVQAGERAITLGGLLEAAAQRGTLDERAIVELTLRPRVHLLALSRHSRVFTSTTATDAIVEVLTEAGLSAGTDFELRTGESYPTLSQIVQYRESDLAFVTRMCRRHGLFFFFEQGDADKLVIADHPSAFPSAERDPVPYRPIHGSQRLEHHHDAIERLRYVRRMVPASVTVADHDHERPALRLSEEANVEGATHGDVVDFPAGFHQSSQGAALATHRAEALGCRGQELTAEGPILGLAAGRRMTLQEHPRDAVNGDYLVDRLEHRGALRVGSDELTRLVGLREGDVYHARARLLRADAGYRMEPPEGLDGRVPSLERGRVEGPASSDYAQLDGAGRYRIKLAFDESDREGDEASLRARMIQPHAGSPEGWHLPLRKNTEVMVGFVASDGDRPVLAGAVPEARTPSVVTSDNHTRNILRTGGVNELEIEDNDEAQWIDLRSPVMRSHLHLGTPHDDHSHYVVGRTDGDARFSVGGSQDIQVGAKLTETVRGHVDEDYHTSQSSTVAAAQQSVVTGDVSEDYDSGHGTTTSGTTLEMFGSSQSTTVAGNRFELLSMHSTTALGAVTQSFGATHDLLSFGPSLQAVGGSKTLMASGTATFDFGPTTQLFGPTTWIAGTSTYDIPGACDVFASKWDLTLGSWNLASNVLTHIATNGIEVTLLKLAAYGATATATGALVELNGLKAEAIGAAKALFGIQIELTGANVQIKGTAAEADGGNVER